jgi:hypothetical protein
LPASFRNLKRNRAHDTHWKRQGRVTKPCRTGVAAHTHRLSCSRRFECQTRQVYLVEPNEPRSVLCRAESSQTTGRSQALALAVRKGLRDVHAPDC